MTDHQQKVHDYKAQDFWHSLKPKGCKNATELLQLGKP